jgi:hypothetical protein
MLKIFHEFSFDVCVEPMLTLVLHIWYIIPRSSSGFLHAVGEWNRIFEMYPHLFTDRFCFAGQTR